VAAGTVVLIMLAASTIWSPPFLSPMKSAAAQGVINPSAAANVSNWTADSDGAQVRLVRVPVAHGPSGTRTAIDIQRTEAPAKWAMAMAGLRTPQTFFRVGRSYEMRAYVRDMNASGQAIGLLLANENFDHRPTGVSRYESYRDRSWHLLKRTFVCTDPASSDTALYVALPPSGALHFQLTATSVREVTPARPPRINGTPKKVLTFNGASGTAPDKRVWNHELGGNGWGNNELQTYTASTANSHLDGKGHLVITARREDAVGRDGIARQYTSARLTTKGTIEVLPRSYVEAAIRAPVGAGVWPAFWLLGSDISEVGWPACGELDVVEVIGANPTVAHSMIHVATQSDPREDAPYPREEGRGTVDLRHPADSRTHRYGVYFDSKMVRFYVDRKERLAFGAEDAWTSGRTWPFDKPMFLVLNVAVGGTGDPSATSFPRSMIVDGISIWKGGTPF
jgi:beta-glucanase (GH16 family)